MDMHSGTFNPQDLLARLNADTRSGDTHPRAGGKAAWYGRRRLGVKQTGCAGFGYVLDSVSEPDKDDLLFEHDGAKLFVPLQSMPFIDGTEVDSFVKDLIRYSNFTTLKPRMNVAVAKALGYRRYYVS